MKYKKCGLCRQRKAVSDFYKNCTSRDGLQSRCKTCSLEYRKQQNAKHRAAGIMTHSQRTRRRLRREVLQAYSDTETAACSCCGENCFEFLVIDHIDGGGGEHRKEIGHSGLYAWLKRNGYPAGFRVLCHNCNHAYAAYGRCPHQSQERLIENPPPKRRTSRSITRDLQAALLQLQANGGEVTIATVAKTSGVPAGTVGHYRRRLIASGDWPGDD